MDNNNQRSTYYDYEFLLNRIYENPKLGLKTTHEYHILTPEVTRTLNRKKLQISNFVEICQHFNRTFDELKNFLTAELKTSGSLTNENKLILRGNLTENKIQNLLIKYANEYVICKECKSHDTKIVKRDRITYLSCQHCLSEKAIDY